MRIFTLDNIITCVLLDNSAPDPQHIKKPHYQLKVFPYCKNDSKYISLDSVQKILTNMNVLCLDSIIEPDKINIAKTIKTKPFAKIEREAIAQIKKKGIDKLRKILPNPNQIVPHKKLFSKKIKKHLVKYKFFNLVSSAFPVFLFYKQGKSELNIQELSQSFNNYWYKLLAAKVEISILKKDASEIECDPKIICDMHNNPEEKLLGLLEIIKKLEEQFSINIFGIFIDPYFINKQDNKLNADNIVEKRYSLSITIPNMIETVKQLESSSLDQDDFQLSKSRVNVNAFGAANCHIQLSKSLLSLDDFSLQTHLDSMEIYENLNLEAYQGHKKSNSSTMSVNKNDVFTEDSFSVWKTEARKDKIKNLLKGYQAQLQKCNFFYNPSITKNKQILINELLNKLDDSSTHTFLEQIHHSATADILNQHRNFFYFPILSYLFNTNIKTKGGLLLESILVNLEENKSITLSIKH